MVIVGPGLVGQHFAGLFGGLSSFGSPEDLAAVGRFGFVGGRLFPHFSFRSCCPLVSNGSERLEERAHNTGLAKNRRRCAQKKAKTSGGEGGGPLKNFFQCTKRARAFYFFPSASGLPCLFFCPARLACLTVPSAPDREREQELVMDDGQTFFPPLTCAFHSSSRRPVHPPHHAHLTWVSFLICKR